MNPLDSDITFAELLGYDGVLEESALRSRFGFMAFHGGSLEEMTDVIAGEAADRAGASYYGVIHPKDLECHIPSHRVVREHSPTLATFLDHVDVVITVHGFGRMGMFASLLLGGQNRELATHVARCITARLPAYEIVTDLERIPRELRGMHDLNPVNQPRQQGVQIELPPRVRGSSPMWADWEGPGFTPHTEGLIDALASAARDWPALRVPTAG